MPSFRDRERDEAEAQAKKTAAQREELKKRAAKRAKERAKAGLGATTSATGNKMTARPAGTPAGFPRTGPSAAPLKQTAGVSGRPPRPGGGSHGPRDTHWGLAPSEWTGDVGAELVTLQAQNLALRREREMWEAERKRLEDAAKAAGMPQYGRVTQPSPPPPSIPESDDEDEEARPRPRGGGAASLPRATPRDSNSRASSRPSSSRGSGRHRRIAAETIDDVFGGGDENAPPRTLDLDPHGVPSGDSSPDASRAVFDAVNELSGAEAMTALMLAEMRASRGAVADLRREMRLERERARQAEARQRRTLEQTLSLIHI